MSLAGSERLVVLCLALALDALIGDPDVLWRRWPHPVVWIGRAIGWADRRLNDPASGERVRRRLGVGFVLLLVAGALAVGFAIEAGCRRLPFGDLPLALVASVLLAGGSLRDHVRRVATAFAAGGLPAARGAVAMIVGRDPERLDEAGTVRAAIESAAENLSDGLVAPAFWFALLGLPGLVAYKAINTADSMIGHLSERHRAFGWAAARLDDAVNLLPARLTGLLLALAAPAGGGRIGDALRVMRRDAGLHRSPNAGWPEAAMAGALGLALGGPRAYSYGIVDEPFLNRTGRTEAAPADIGRALRVLAVAAALQGGLYGLLALALRVLA